MTDDGPLEQTLGQDEDEDDWLANFIGDIAGDDLTTQTPTVSHAPARLIDWYLEKKRYISVKKREYRRFHSFVKQLAGGNSLFSSFGAPKHHHHSSSSSIQRLSNSAHLATNFYTQIMSFETTLVALEKSCIKLASSLLEGYSSLDNENVEIPMILIHDIGKENLVCNMANYWQRSLNYQSIFNEFEADDSYEQPLAYAYYGLVNRIIDLNSPDITDDLKDLVSLWLHKSEIEIEKVSFRYNFAASFTHI